MIDGEFEALLKGRMGLDAASIGPASIERAVQSRVAACNLTDVRAYLERVRSSETELQELIEAVVVPETWFFRDKEAFAMLARTVCEEWLRVHPRDVLRLLSLPCATGEEPFSIAMALLEAGVPAGRFRVDAVDISARCLARARRAVYGRNSFRGTDLGFRDRHFEVAQDGYQLAAAVRQQVCFQQANLFDAGLLPGAEIYDVVFCRNVLIYFDRATQDRVITVLTRLLAQQGLLFVGPSETGLLLSHGFSSAKVPLAFAFRRGGAPPPELTPAGIRAVGLSAIAPPRALPARPPAPARVASAEVVYRDAAIAPPPTPGDGLDEAARLADRGRLVEAAKQCEAHLSAHGPSAKAFYLLALVRDAAGDHAAAAHGYRRALYLDPDHREALVHLSLLLDRQGDKGAAKVLNERARRLGQERPA